MDQDEVEYYAEELTSEADLDTSKNQESDDENNTVIFGYNVYLRYVEIAKTIMPHIDPSLNKRQAMILVWDEKAAAKLQKVLNQVLNAESEIFRIRHVNNRQSNMEKLNPHVVIASTENIATLFDRELQDISCVKFAAFDNPSDIFSKLKLRPVNFPSGIRIILSFPKSKCEPEIIFLLRKALSIVQPAAVVKESIPIDDGIKAYIVQENYPIKKAHCVAIQNLIVNHVLDLPPDDPFTPSFLGYSYLRSKQCMVVICRTEETKRWLFSIVNGNISRQFKKKLTVLDDLN